MKIKVKEADYASAASIKRPKRQKPKKQSPVFAWLMKTLSEGELKAANFTYRSNGMEKLAEDQPCIYLMNHSSFIDLKIASKIIYPRKYNIICTSDGFVGKEWLMRSLGCVPTAKFVNDLGLIRDMRYILNDLNSSVLLYPEASYSFDGRATPLPSSLGGTLKMLGAPVVMIRTYGAFSRDPLYNGLQIRNVEVSAEVTYLLSPDELREKSQDEINRIVGEKFGFDNFAWQRENKIKIDEPFRADFLHRVLYKCPHCMSEGKMLGKGDRITCRNCGREYLLDEYGSLAAIDGQPAFTSVPEWYAWERECVKNEISEGKYLLDIEVDVCMMVDMKCIYRVGSGRLVHDSDGFRLTGCGGRLDYRRSPLTSYGLYADYYWYEIGDMICIGDNQTLYYLFPKDQSVPVAKARIAAEEMYKIKLSEKRKVSK